MALAQAQKPPQPPPEVVNSSLDAPVFRGDGIQLFGLDAELELKVRFYSSRVPRLSVLALSRPASRAPNATRTSSGIWRSGSRRWWASR